MSGGFALPDDGSPHLTVAPDVGALRADDVVEIISGEGPIVLGQPHVGLGVPGDVLGRLNARGRALRDTDWWIDHLYEDLLPGATTVRARLSRYVIDVNRSPDDVSLYPGQNTTGLCPTTDFDGASIWCDGSLPTPADISLRREKVHSVYHGALRSALDRARARHGFAVLYDCHSIRSEVPFLFDGVLPIFNVGTNCGLSAAPVLADAVEAACRRIAPNETVRDGRFKGGWTTRHYGRPSEGLHAVQMEIAQRAYLIEWPNWAWNDEVVEETRAVLMGVFDAIQGVLPQLAKPHGPR